MKKISQDTLETMCRRYESGKTIKEISGEFDVSAGKTFYLLRDAGCTFRRGGGHPWTEEAKRKISIAHKGKMVSEETKAKLREAKKQHLNGLNGYGHTKRHNKGYELVYAPCHPHAHRDGYVMKHTVIMERHIGRYLHDDEEVHHINHIRNDNRIENLTLMDKHEHRLLHMRERNEARRNDLSTQ